MRNRPAAAHAGFGAPDAPQPINNAASPPPGCRPAPVSMSFERRDTRSATVVGNPIFWQVWRPKSAVPAYGALERALLGANAKRLRSHGVGCGQFNASVKPRYQAV